MASRVRFYRSYFFVYPIILLRSLGSHIKPSLDCLKMYLGTNDKVVAAVKRASWLLTSDLKGTIQPNIELLIGEGVPINNVSKLIKLEPRAILQKVDRMAHTIETVKKLGLQPTAPMFIHAIRVMVSLSESTWNRKIEVFKSLGWSEEDIKSTFKREPYCLACSEEKIKTMMDFFVNTMKVDRTVIIACPKVLMHGIDTRIHPRYNVLKVLESKMLLKDDKKPLWAIIQKKKKPLWAFTISEKRFLEKFVMKHSDQVPHLLELYRGTVPSSKIGL